VYWLTLEASVERVVDVGVGRQCGMLVPRLTGVAAQNVHLSLAVVQRRLVWHFDQHRPAMQRSAVHAATAA